MINQQHTELQSHSAGAHSSAFVDRMAHSLGFYAARTYLGVQHITHINPKGDQLHNKSTEIADHCTQPSKQESNQIQSPAEDSLRSARAEKMLDNFNQQFSSFTTNLKRSFQRTTARVREDTEDLWAEAQDIRYHKSHPTPQ